MNFEHVRQFPAVLIQSVKDLYVDDGPQWAASIAYYALLSSLPLLIVGVMAVDLVADPEPLMRHAVEIMRDFMPEGEEEIDSIVEEALSAQNRIGLFAFIGLLWSGTRVFKTLTRAMNIAFGIEERHGFFASLGIQILMLFTVGMFFVFALMSGFLTRTLWDALRILPGDEGLLFTVVTSAVRAGVLLVAFYLVYWLVPRNSHHRRASLVGAVVATVLFLVGSPLFRYWVTEFGDQEVIYGRLAMLVIVLLWIWITSLITLFGGEVAAHTEAMIFRGKRREDLDRERKERAGKR